MSRTSFLSIKSRRDLVWLFIAAVTLTALFVVVRTNIDSRSFQYEQIIDGVRSNVRDVHSMGLRAVKASADVIAGFVSGNVEQEKASMLNTMKFLLRTFNELGGSRRDESEDWILFIDKVTLPLINDASIQGFIEFQRSKLQDTYREVVKKSKGVKKRKKIPQNGATINMGVIACGSRVEQAITMMKSATLFSQDAKMHFIVFSDADAMLQVGTELIKLRWSANVVGWDFTFELHDEWYPEPAGWRIIYKKCATLRLFFTSLLPHIDSLIYLDTDTLVLSNLTEFWNHFQNDMKDKKMIAAANNDEDLKGGWYSGGRTKIPYYGKHGLNSGVLLMNLTQLRSWNFQDRSVATRLVYKEKMSFSDQDILNVLFHTYSKLLHEIPCTYNFHWAHCGGNKDSFCKAAIKSGIRIVHGNSGTFASDKLHFLKDMYNGFKKFDLMKDSPVKLIQKLKDNYKSKNQSLCHDLTEEILYKNAEKYLKKLY